MDNQAGFITYTDKNQVQQTAETADYAGFCSSMAIIKTGDFRNFVSDIFANGSMKRSQFYVNLRIRDFVSRAGKQSGLCPAYGVKGGSPDLTRKTNYVQCLLCSEEELEGAHFNERIFGTEYLTGKDTVYLSEQELLAAMQKPLNPCKEEIKPSDLETVVRIVEKLWEAQEQDPRTRFVVYMHSAEDRSASLLQQVFLLLPHRLKMQLGFETNIGAGDLNQIRDYGGIPIYVFTTEASEEITPDNYDFPMAFYRAEEPDQYTYRQERVDLIRKLAQQMSRETSFTLDYAERKILEENRDTVSSFRYYQNILEMLFSGEFFWWKKDSIDTVEELEKMYLNQNELMQMDSYRRDALKEFRSRILPESGIPEQITEMVLNASYPNRDRLIQFLCEKLGLEKPIRLLVDSCRRIQDQGKAETEKVRQAGQQEADKLRKTVAELEHGKTESESRIKDLTGELKKQKDEVQDLSEQCRKLDDRNKDLENQISGPDNNINRVKTLKKAVRKAKRDKTTFLIIAIAGMIAAVVFGTLFFLRNKTLTSVRDELEAAQVQQQGTEKQLTAMQDELNTVRKELQTAEESLAKSAEEIAALNTEKDSLTAQLALLQSEESENAVTETAEAVNRVESAAPEAGSENPAESTTDVTVAENPEQGD